LAVETFQSDQSFGALANRLASQGLIERRPGRGRRIEHRLTAAGTKTLAAGHPVAEAVFRSSFADLSQKERSTLLALLLRTAAEESD
jgi:DNA-binding MarR family transcriptional regulator